MGRGALVAISLQLQRALSLRGVAGNQYSIL